MDSFGKITGTHGVKGHLVIEHILKEPINTSSWDALLIELLPDSRIPFFIESIKKQNGNRFLVKLEEINSPEEARGVMQKNIFASPNYNLQAIIVKQQADNYIGYTLFDKEKKVGIIDNILNPKTNPLFILFEHAENEILIPANEELILEIDESNKKVIADLPEGLY